MHDEGNTVSAGLAVGGPFGYPADVEVLPSTHDRVAALQQAAGRHASAGHRLHHAGAGEGNPPMYKIADGRLAATIPSAVR